MVIKSEVAEEQENISVSPLDAWTQAYTTLSAALNLDEWGSYSWT